MMEGLDYFDQICIPAMIRASAGRLQPNFLPNIYMIDEVEDLYAKIGISDLISNIFVSFDIRDTQTIKKYIIDFLLLMLKSARTPENIQKYPELHLLLNNRIRALLLESRNLHDLKNFYEDSTLESKNALYQYILKIRENNFMNKIELAVSQNRNIKKVVLLAVALEPGMREAIMQSNILVLDITGGKRKRTQRKRTHRKKTHRS